MDLWINSLLGTWLICHIILFYAGDFPSARVEPCWTYSSRWYFEQIGSEMFRVCSHTLWLWAVDQQTKSFDVDKGSLPAVAWRPSSSPPGPIEASSMLHGSPNYDSHQNDHQRSSDHFSGLPSGNDSHSYGKSCSMEKITINGDFL